MTESEKPEGDLKDAEGVGVDKDGNVEMKMETLELSDGSEAADDD